MIRFYFRFKKMWRDFITAKRLKTELEICDSYDDLIKGYFEKAKNNMDKYKLHIAESIQRNETMQDSISEQAQQAIRVIEIERDIKTLELLQQNDKLKAKKTEFFGDSEGEENGR